MDVMKNSFILNLHNIVLTFIYRNHDRVALSAGIEFYRKIITNGSLWEAYTSEQLKRYEVEGLREAEGLITSDTEEQSSSDSMSCSWIILSFPFPSLAEKTDELFRPSGLTWNGFLFSIIYEINITCNTAFPSADAHQWKQLFDMTSSKPTVCALIFLDIWKIPEWCTTAFLNLFLNPK